MLWTMALPMIVAAADCPAAPQSIPVTITTIAAAAIDATPDPGDATVLRVGPFAYQGNGIAVRSTDPRFRDLTLDQRFGIGHRCGNPVFPPSPWNGPRTGSISGAVQVEAIRGPREESPGATEAERHGARPILAGHVAGPSWPVFHAGGRFFVGLMYPADDAGKSRIVAFRDEPRPTPALILATIPMRLQVANVIPGLHEAADYLYLAALGPAEMVQITLRSDAAAKAKIARTLEGSGE